LSVTFINLYEQLYKYVDPIHTMASKRVLFISGSLGLGHAVRDVAIVKELRALNPDIEVHWIAPEPAATMIAEAGEHLLPESSGYSDNNAIAEANARGTSLNILAYMLKARKDWAENVELFRKLTTETEYDLVVGDETYEVAAALNMRPSLKRSPFAMIYDFVGVDTGSWNPLERLSVYLLNWIWSQDYTRAYHPDDLSIFIGEPEDIPDKRFGLFLPSRREYAEARLRPVGYILQFEPDDYRDKSEIRGKLGYGDEPLLLCSAGGTAIGGELLDLCIEAYGLAREEMPDLRMVVVCGPRIPPESIEAGDGIQVHGYLPRLYEHLAACDLAIVQAGATTTLELTSLNRPFIYFPIEGHFEQERHVAGRLGRHEAGVRMTYSDATPESLAQKITENIGKQPEYEPIPVDGAEKAASLLNQLLTTPTMSLSPPTRQGY